MVSGVSSWIGCPLLCNADLNLFLFIRSILPKLLTYFGIPFGNGSQIDQCKPGYNLKGLLLVIKLTKARDGQQVYTKILCREKGKPRPSGKQGGTMLG